MCSQNFVWHQNCGIAEKKIPAFTALINVAFCVEEDCREVRVRKNLLMALFLASVQKAASF